MVAGGKYTTYRVMAKDAVDAAVHALPRKVPESCTEHRAAGRRRGLRRARGTSVARGPTEVRRARRVGRAPAGPLRHAHRRAARADAGAPRARRAAGGRADLPPGGGLLRRAGRGRAAPRRHPDPAHPHLDRDLRPGPGLGPAGRRAGGAGARLGPGHGRRRGRALPRAGRGRAASRRSSPTTRPPTRPGSARPRCAGWGWSGPPDSGQAVGMPCTRRHAHGAPCAGVRAGRARRRTPRQRFGRRR